jgi:hypothetical protein
MIGQKDLLEKFNSMIDDRTVEFPHFIILVGNKGSGKKTSAEELYKRIAASTTMVINKYVLEDTKADTIRAMISDAQKAIDPVIYIIPDADTMSTTAKNVMLKITEEPPDSAWFIITLENENNTLATIRSRGQMYRLEPYSPETIVQYAKDKFGISDVTEIEILADICETPGEVDFLHKTGIISLYDYVTLVIDNIAECSGSNAFKIADKIALKNEDDKYDLRLFWKAFMKVCSDRMRSEMDIKYANAIKITSEYMQQLNVTGINRSSTFDLWILAVRESWL